MTRPLSEIKRDLIRRVLDISYEHNLSHLGSVLTSLDPLIDIYTHMDTTKDKFVLSAGHAGLALYVILENMGFGDAELMLKTAGIHPDISINNRLAVEYGKKEDPIHCSTGSLGQGLPIALGMAIANPDINVYCMISDGECAEGSIWEALRIADNLGITNLKIYVNINGYGGYSTIDGQQLEMRLKMFYEHLQVYYTSNDWFDFLGGLDAHYHVMNEDEYNLAINKLGDKKDEILQKSQREV